MVGCSGREVVRLVCLHTRVACEPVESRLGGVLLGVGDVSAVVPVARIDPSPVYVDYTRPCGAATSSVRDNLVMRCLDLILAADI